MNIRCTSLFFKWSRTLPVIVMAGCASLVETPDQAMDRMRKEGAQEAVTTLTSPSSPEARVKAVEELSGKDDASTIDLLRRSLSDSDARVRTAAAEALRESDDNGTASAGDVMAALQKESDAVAAVSMGWTLRRWKTSLEPARDALVVVLNQKANSWARYNAALLLAPISDVALIAPAVVDTLGTDVAKNARNKPEDLLAEWIPNHGNVILPLLTTASKSSTTATRVAVASLLYHFKPQMSIADIMRQRVENPNVRVGLTTLPAGVEEVFTALLHDSEPNVRAAAAHAAGMCQPAPASLIPRLLALLKDSEPSVRAESVSSLGQYVALTNGPEGALDAMGALLEDASVEVRASASLTLANMGPLPENITRAFLRRITLTVEQDATVRANAATALGNGAAIPDVNAALLGALDDRNETVIERALASIGRREAVDPQALAKVSARVASSHPLGVRLSAIGALHSIGPAAQSALPALTTAQSDPNSSIREAATEAIARISAIETR